jgi:hypothetical protein
MLTSVKMVEHISKKVQKEYKEKGITRHVSFSFVKKEIILKIKKMSDLLNS